MNRKYNIVAFIPVRGGSKSIPLKNIKKINNEPLIFWTLRSAILCKEIDKVFVSTDSDEIRKVVKSYNYNKVEVINRSRETALDTSSTESAMLEFAKDYNFNIIILIQATSPLLAPDDLKKGIYKFDQDGIDSVLSVVRQKRFIWQEKNHKVQPLNYTPKCRPRRQEFDGFLVENGAFYITSRINLLNTGCRLSGNIGFVEMNQDTYYEIDEPSDWIVVEQLLKKTKRNNNIYKKASQIKLLITDCDGVLTDGGMYYSENGDEMKKFNTKDGMAVQLLRENGIKTAVITGEKVELVNRRVKKLKIDELYMGIKNKGEIVKRIANKYDISLNEVAYVGDDVNDLSALKIVGLSICVADGMEKVKNICDYITKVKGGKGALREIAELILKNRVIER